MTPTTSSASTRTSGRPDHLHGRALTGQFRNEIVTGVGGKQILLDDPSGNPIELFEPAG
jgi:hypothetical protein